MPSTSRLRPPLLALSILSILPALLVVGCGSTRNVGPDESFRLHRNVTVTTNDGMTLHANEARKISDSLRFVERNSRTVHTIPLAQVDRVTVRSHVAGLEAGAKTGAKVGAGVGGSIGLLTGLGLASDCGAPCIVFVPLLLGSVGGGYGAVIGGVAGFIGGEGDSYRFLHADAAGWGADSTTDAARDAIRRVPHGPPDRRLGAGGGGAVARPAYSAQSRARQDSLRALSEQRADSVWTARNLGKVYFAGDFGGASSNGFTDPQRMHDGGGATASFGVGRVVGQGKMIGGRLSLRHHAESGYAWNPVTLNQGEFKVRRISLDPQVEIARLQPATGHMARFGIGASQYHYTRTGPDPVNEFSMGMSASLGYNYVFGNADHTQWTLGLRLLGVRYYDGTSALSWQATLGFLNL